MQWPSLNSGCSGWKLAKVKGCCTETVHVRRYVGKAIMRLGCVIFLKNWKRTAYMCKQILKIKKKCIAFHTFWLYQDMVRYDFKSEHLLAWPEKTLQNYICSLLGNFSNLDFNKHTSFLHLRIINKYDFEHFWFLNGKHLRFSIDSCLQSSECYVDR